MSHHAQLSPEAIQKLQAQKRNSTISAIIIALLISGLIVLALTLIAISSIFKNEEELVSYSPASENFEEIVKPEMTTEVEKKPSSPSSSMSKVIASNTPSPTAIPVPKDVAVEPSLDFGSGTDFGDGWGGSGFGEGSGGGGKSTPFGKTGGAGLKGAFYDFKQDRDKEATQLAKDYSGSGTPQRIAAYRKEIVKLNRSQYSASSLKDVYKADVELTFTHLVLPYTSAVIAPEAFGVEKEVDPSGWLIVYEGRIAQNAPNRVKFTGRFDDLLIVYINGKVVFDGSWSNYLGKLNERNQIPGPSLVKKKMIRNDDFISLSKGDNIRILVGESPGGSLGGGLFVAEEGVDYKKNDAGQDILPPFAAQPLTREDIKRLKDINYPMELKKVPVFRME